MSKEQKLYYINNFYRTVKYEAKDNLLFNFWAEPRALFATLETLNTESFKRRLTSYKQNSAYSSELKRHVLLLLKEKAGTQDFYSHDTDDELYDSPGCCFYVIGSSYDHLSPCKKVIFCLIRISCCVIMPIILGLGGIDILVEGIIDKKTFDIIFGAIIVVPSVVLAMRALYLFAKQLLYPCCKKRHEHSAFVINYLEREMKQGSINV